MNVRAQVNSFHHTEPNETPLAAGRKVSRARVKSPRPEAGITYAEKPEPTCHRENLEKNQEFYFSSFNIGLNKNVAMNPCE